MPRILITGAAGFIGMHTSIRFLKEGWDVIGLDNLNDYYSKHLKEDRISEIERCSLETTSNFKLYPNDLNSAIWSKLKNYSFDGVIHLAAQAGVRYSIENPRAYLHSNISGFQEVIEFVNCFQRLPFVYASSSSVYGKDSEQPFSESEPCVHPESYYAATKRANELMAHSYFKTSKLKSIGLRFFTVYGPWGRPDMAPYLFVSAAFNKKPIQVFNHGNQKRDFTYIDDIVQGIWLSISQFHLVHGAEVFNIGNGAPVGLMQFISEIEGATGEILKKSFVDAQPCDVPITFADTSTLKRTFGYTPDTDLREGVLQFVNWYRNYYDI